MEPPVESPVESPIEPAENTVSPTAEPSSVAPRRDNRVVLQINSLAVLERLLGGDSKFEVEVRDSVAAAFARAHLQECTRAHLERLLRKANGDLLAELDKLVINRDRIWNQHIRPTNEVETVIQTTAKRVLQKQIEEAVTNCHAEAQALLTTQMANLRENILPRLLQTQFDKEVNKLVSEQVAGRLQQIIKDAEAAARAELSKLPERQIHVP